LIQEVFSMPKQWIYSMSVKEFVVRKFIRKSKKLVHKDTMNIMHAHICTYTQTHTHTHTHTHTQEPCLYSMYVEDYPQ
jgi:hypothetical protein